MSGPSRLRPEKTPEWRKLQAFRRRLETAGHLDAADRDHIKRIVVIGGQSAGKSALVSMLTAVKLESSTKATTRGPTIFRFLKGEDKQCYQIWPEFVEDAEGKALPKPIKGDVEICKAGDLSNKIKSLHRLVLRPEFDADDYIDSEEIPLTQRLADVNQAFFTRNKVIVQKTGSDMPDLEIIDLPGLQVSSQHPEMLGKIKAITKEYLNSTPHAFAIGVCPANSEPESQEVPNIIRAWDSSFSRTLIALSRADEMTGDECAWHELIEKYKGSFCFVASSIPTGLRANLEELEASERQVLDNMKVSRTTYMHKGPELLGVSNLIRLIVLKMDQMDKSMLQLVKKRLAGDLKDLVAQDNMWKRDAVVGEINTCIDSAAEQVQKALVRFERSQDPTRDRHCAALAEKIQQVIERIEWPTPGEGSATLFRDMLLKAQQEWKPHFESHERRVWSGLLYQLQASMPAALPSNLSMKVWKAIESLVELQQSACQRFVASLFAQYSGELGIVTCDLVADQYYRHEYLRLPSTNFIGSPPSTPTPTGITLPLTPPASLKRSSNGHLEGEYPKRRLSGDPRINLKHDQAVEQAKQTRMYLHLTQDRLIIGVQDRISHSILQVGCGSSTGLSHAIRDAVGTNRVLDLDSAVAIMASSPAEAEERSKKVDKLKELLAFGEQALAQSQDS